MINSCRKLPLFILLLLHLTLFSLPLFSEELSITGKLFQFDSKTILIRFTINEHWHINSNNSTDMIPTVLTVNGAAKHKVIFPPAVNRKFQFSENPVAVFENTFDVAVRFENDFKGEFQALLSYQGCSDNVCAMPSEYSVKGVPVAFPANGTLQGGLVLAVAEPALPKVVPVKDNSKTAQKKSKNEQLEDFLKSQPLYLVLAGLFLLGLGLNLTPCVYPMIPITIGFFVQQSSDNFTRQLMLAISYFLGICLTYSMLGLVAAQTGSLFGSHMQNPAVIIGVAVIFLVLALSLLGFYELNPPASLMNKLGGSRSGYFGSAFMGATVGVVGAPCVGPVLLVLLAYVGKLQSAFLGFLYFFALSSGLGFPYLLLGIFSGSIKSIPRAGGWMNTVKKVFGIILIGLAWQTLTPLAPSQLLASIGWLLFAFWAFIYMFMQPASGESYLFKAVKWCFVIVIALFGTFQALPQHHGFVLVEYGLPLSKGLIRFHKDSSKVGNDVKWQKFTRADFDRAIAARQPVLIDFRADWCGACKQLERETFPDTRVQAELKRFVLFKIDMTHKDIPADQNAIKDELKVAGLPFLAFYSNGKEVKEARLAGFLPPEKFLSHLKKIK